MDNKEMIKLLNNTPLEELRVLSAAKLLMEDGHMKVDQALTLAQRLAKLPTQLGVTAEEAAMLVCDMAEEFDIDALSGASDVALSLYLDNAFLGWTARAEEVSIPPAKVDGDKWVALVPQECDRCGKTFLLQYEGTPSADKKSVIPGYQYLGEPCGCVDADFSPKDGLSLGEWAEAIQEDPRLSLCFLEA